MDLCKIEWLKWTVTATASSRFSLFPSIPIYRDYCVHRNTASCVLSISKQIRMLKTTCPCRGQKTPSEVRVLYKLKMDE